MNRLPPIEKLEKLAVWPIPWQVKPSHWGNSPRAIKRRKLHELVMNKRLEEKLIKAGETPAGKGIASVTKAKLGKVLSTLGPYGAVLGGSLAIVAAAAGVKKAHEALTRDKDFNRALAESPRLRKEKTRAYKHFMTLRRVNGKLSRDPMVAAGYMNKAMSFEQEGIDPSIALALKGDREVPQMNVAQAADVLGKMSISKDF